MRYPTWFPYPTAWLKALVLLTLLEVLWRLFKPELERLALEPLPPINEPQTIIFWTSFTLLSPIAFIAGTHYLIHCILGQLSHNIQSPKVRQKPLLMSLWEGVWGWTVIFITVCALSGFISIVPGLAEQSMTSYRAENFLRGLWMIVSAYLYQLEHLVQYCVPVIANPASSSKPQTDAVKDINQLRANSGLTQMRTPNPRKPNIP